MKLLKKFALLILMFPMSIFCEDISVMSFNIRYENTYDGSNSWDNRKSDMTKMLNYYHPDIIGLQEVLINPLIFLKSQLSRYSYVGVGREDGKEKGEFAPIFYNKEKYELIKFKTFWLSEHDDIISKGWDAVLERICTYCALKERNSGDTIHVFNTHFDHIGVIARLNSAKLILKKINEIKTSTARVILMGDLNSTPDMEQIKLLKKELHDACEASKSGLYGPERTFNGFSDTISEKIDYIFVDNFTVESFRNIDDRTSNNSYLSDHFPVFAILKK